MLEKDVSSGFKPQQPVRTSHYCKLSYNSLLAWGKGFSLRTAGLDLHGGALRIASILTSMLESLAWVGMIYLLQHPFLIIRRPAQGWSLEGTKSHLLQKSRWRNSTGVVPVPRKHVKQTQVPVTLPLTNLKIGPPAMEDVRLHEEHSSIQSNCHVYRQDGEQLMALHWKGKMSAFTYMWRHELRPDRICWDSELQNR